MKDFNWQQVQEIFAAAVALEGRERQDYLKNVEITSRELYPEVISLLAADNLDEIMPNSTADFGSLTKDGFSAADTMEFDKFETIENFSLAGEIINDRYLIVKRLGSGGMGDVYLARDRNLMNRETVVKLLKSEVLANKEIIRKFKQEIEALARVKDPGIVMILDAGTYGKQPFLVIEYVEGEDLAGIISPLMFSVRDFLAPHKLASRLFNQETAIESHLWQKFGPESQSVLRSDTDERKIAVSLRDEFNRLLGNPHLYDSQIFGSAASLFPTRESVFEDSSRSVLKSNRLLLESVFPAEIVAGRDKKITAAEAAVIFRQLGESLTHGHNKGIIHRDLKPANIMVTRSPRGDLQTKLIDFGVAKVRESLVAPTTEFGLSFGTRKYMSPEQINSKPDITPAADIYALGLIAFEALTGQHIFRTDSFAEQCRMQENEDFSDITVLRPDLPPKVRDVICRALSYNPENRQTSAVEFGNALSAALLDSQVDANEVETVISRKTDSGNAAEKTQPSIKTYENISLRSETPGTKKSPGKTKAPVLFFGAVIILALMSFGGWLIWRQVFKSSSTSAPIVTDDAINREINYQLIVQKYYQGKPFQTAFKATGDEIFGDEWHFRINFNSPENGNLYLLAENSQTKNLTMLFPHPQKNGGSAALSANQSIETNEMAFDKNQGTEKFWIIWTGKSVAELEAVKSAVNAQDLGRIKDADKEKAIRDFLNKTISQEKLIEKSDTDKQLKTVQTSSDILVKQADFRHN